MTHILWLASYPKSGNTWVRALLANTLLAAGDRAFDINRLAEFSFSDTRRSYYTQVAGGDAAALDGSGLARLRPAVHRMLAKARPGRVFVKTHAANVAVDGVPLITPEVSEGAVVIVRNPLDMVVSFADHYGLSLDNAIKATAFPALELKGDAATVRQRIGDWSSHVESWQRPTPFPRLLIRYEDLSAAPGATFARVLAFLAIPVDPARLDEAIARSRIEELQAQEAAAGFIERSKSAARFFRQGRVGGWREALSEAQAAAVIARHGRVMRALGYLDARGEPQV
jgi:hypothetical protein